MSSEAETPAPATSAADSPAVVLESVGLRYGNGPEVLDSIGLVLARGSFHFLTGPSGAGKSSLLSLLTLVRRPSRGTVTLFGHPTAVLAREDLPLLRRRIGVVFQDFRLLDRLSVYDNVALPLRIAGASEADIARQIPDLLKWVGLGGHVTVRPPLLSGGQQQRVAIARAVVGRPALLLADEPTGNVDDATAFRLLHLFQELNRHGTTVVIATHNERLTRRFPFPRLHLAHGHIEVLPPAEGDL